MNLSGLRKGWAFITNPNVIMNKAWADGIKWFVMSELGNPHPFDYGIRRLELNVKPKTKEMLGKDLRSNKDCSSK